MAVKNVPDTRTRRLFQSRSPFQRFPASGENQAAAFQSRSPFIHSWKPRQEKKEACSLQEQISRSACRQNQKAFARFQRHIGFPRLRHQHQRRMPVLNDRIGQEYP